MPLASDTRKRPPQRGFVQIAFTLIGATVEAMTGMKVKIVRYISNDPQPGIVECEFEDAYGRRWSFVEKTLVVSAEQLDAHSVYPQPGITQCNIVQRGTLGAPIRASAQKARILWQIG